MLEYLELFNSVQTITNTRVQTNELRLIKRKIAYKLVTNKSYDHLTVCKQMSSDSFKMVSED